MKYSVSESSGFRLAWDIMIIILIIVSCIIVPYSIAFGHLPFQIASLAIVFINGMFLLDIGLNFITSYRQRGTEIITPRKVAVHYLKTFFIIDFIANFPFVVFLFFNQDLLLFNIPLTILFRSLHLLRITRLLIIFRRWQRLSWTNAGYLRVLKYIITVLLSIHLVACAWFLLAAVNGFSNDSWAVLSGITNADHGTQYIRSLYWAITTMTTVGYGDITPHLNHEFLFTCIVMLLGASLYALIIGNIAALISNLNSSKVSYWNKVDAVNQYLRQHHVPLELADKIENYFEYVWDFHKGENREEFLQNLSEPLRLNVLLSLTAELLKKVPLLKNCSAPLRKELLFSLHPQTHAPDTYIVNAGETGKEIFFFTQGEAEIIAEDDKTRHGTFMAGDSFGTFSLMLNEKRTASVKTRSYCELFVLKKIDFLRIKDEYPEFKTVLKKMSSEKTEKIESLLLEGIIL